MKHEEKKYVLIVEDSPEIQFLLSRLLQREGYTVECANNGREAISKLHSLEEAPGLILLDLMMPDMDGYQFRAAQAEHAKTAGIPVVVMTADGGIEAKSMKIGAKGFLKKPFVNVEKILETVGRFF